VYFGVLACEDPPDRPGNNQPTITGPILPSNGQSSTPGGGGGEDQISPQGPPCRSENVGPIFTLEVGTGTDADAAQTMFLLEDMGISVRQMEPSTGRLLRTLAPQDTNQRGRLQFRVRAAALSTQAGGVPDCAQMLHCNAIISIDYQDVVDETNCSSYDDTLSQCRPRLSTRLDFGDNPETEWWATLGGFAGLGDSQWKTASFFLEATPWQMLRSIKEDGEGRLQFCIMYPQPASGATPLPIGRITLRFVDQTCFDTLREEDRTARTLVRREFVESNTLAPGDYPNQNYALYKRNYLQKIYPQTVPAPSEIIPYGAVPDPNSPPDLTAFEVRGQTEPVPFAIYALAGLEDVQVEASALARQDGRAPVQGEQTDIPAQNIRIHKVVAADKRWAYDRDAYYGRQPWYLDNSLPFSVDAQTSQQIWVLIDVPANAAPGTYTGTLLVSGANAMPATRDLSLALTVYDFVLDEPDAPIYLCHSPYLGSLPFGKTREIVAEDMAALGVRSVNTWMSLTWNWNDLQSCVPGNCPIAVTFPQSSQDEIDGLRQVGILNDNLYCFISDYRRTLWQKLCFDGQGIPIPYCEGSCPAFDSVYVDILARYKELYSNCLADPNDPNSGVVPAVSFVDEPGNDPVRRREANHMNRLAKQAGLKTQVAYFYPACEEPLAGWNFKFSQLGGSVNVQSPPWRQGGPHEDLDHLMAYWDFADDGPIQIDRSGHGNTGTLHKEYAVIGGRLELASADAYMMVNPSEYLHLTNEATISFWVRPDDYGASGSEAIMRKGNPNLSDFNYSLYIYGRGMPDLEGTLQWKGMINGNATATSGRARLMQTDLGQWCNVTWVYNAARNGTIYVNGAPSPVAAQGPMTTNDYWLFLGGLMGGIDEIAILNRAVDEQEIVDLMQSATDPAYTNKQLVLSLSLDVASINAVPEMRFLLDDALPAPAGLETGMTLEVNGQTVWSKATQLNGRHRVYTANVRPQLQVGQNVIRWVLVNGYARCEDITLYLVDDFWRNSAWTIDESHDSHWTHSYVADPAGDLGPMSPWLDRPINSLYRVTQEGIDYAKGSPGGYAFYAPYISTQPVLVNNRFLYGIYASALGANGALFYAYADWGLMPWDDTAPSELYRMGGNPNAQRGSAGYHLILPSWENKVYDTVIYESLREGIEDSRIIATLKKAITDHPGAQATAAQAYLDSVFAKPAREIHPRYWSTGQSLPIEKYADRSGEILSDLADGNPNAYGVFDEIRHQMIAHIVILNTLP
jgi:hypothetical protein